VGASIRIRGEGDLEELRARLQAARDHARTQLHRLLDDPNLMDRLKFERLGCDPIDVRDAQNLAEQIDQQATYETAASARTRGDSVDSTGEVEAWTIRALFARSS
jgi:hypothetical protein